MLKNSREGSGCMEAIGLLATDFVAFALDWQLHL